MTQAPEAPFEPSYDVIVAGGGPAGSTVATLLGQRGHRVLLVERAATPQFKVGESLMPATYGVFERLGVLDKMKDSAFPSKQSVQFYSESGRGSAPFYFHEFIDHESSSTWQVVRSEFDQMLLDNAVAQGVEVRRGVTLKEPLFDGGAVVGATLGSAGAEPVEVRCRVLADATGQSTLLARRLNIRNIEPNLKHCAFFTHYDGAVRGEGRDEGATIIYHTQGRKSWFWFIPLPGDRVSIGVVGSVDHLIRDRAADPRQTFEEELDRCPALAERLREARRLLPIQAARDFSYRTERMAGDGWVLVGDAGGFIDPVYSTGVFLALKGGEMAADSIHAALTSNDVSGASLGQFCGGYRAGVDAMRRLVYAFYSETFSFADFLRRHPGCRKDLVDMLMGNVFLEPVDEFLAALDETLQASDRPVEAAQ